MGTRHISPSPRGGEGDDARLTPLKYASIVVSPVYPSRRTDGREQTTEAHSASRSRPWGTPINDACIQRVNWTKIDEIRGVASKIIKWEGGRTSTSDVMRGWCPFLESHRIRRRCIPPSVKTVLSASFSLPFPTRLSAVWLCLFCSYPYKPHF